MARQWSRVRIFEFKLKILLEPEVHLCGTFENKLIFLIVQAKSDSYWYLVFAGPSFENLFRYSDLGFVEIQGLTIWGQTGARTLNLIGKVAMSVLFAFALGFGSFNLN